MYLEKKKKTKHVTDGNRNNNFQKILILYVNYGKHTILMYNIIWLKNIDMFILTINQKVSE